MKGIVSMSVWWHCNIVGLLLSRVDLFLRKGRQIQIPMTIKDWVRFFSRQNLLDLVFVRFWTCHSTNVQLALYPCDTQPLYQQWWYEYVYPKAHSKVITVAFSYQLSIEALQKCNSSIHKDVMFVHAY